MDLSEFKAVRTATQSLKTKQQQEKKTDKPYTDLLMEIREILRHRNVDKNPPCHCIMN